MARLQLEQKSQRPTSVKDAFSRLKPKAAKPFDYEVDELIDGRALRPGETERIVAMLSYKSVHARCAAAYIIARLGIGEALPELRKGLKKTKSSTVSYMFELALSCLQIQEQCNCRPEKSVQLLTLMKLRTSGNEEEAKFADIVLKRADIKYGTITSY
jgi:hypothetical protein